ncbi:hypothetical protein CJO76_08215 [Ralstonia solanacearum]|nr:hypothetical protein CJO76_08215 [Ralstonia solanacearum]
MRHKFKEGGAASGAPFFGKTKKLSMYRPRTTLASMGADWPLSALRQTPLSWRSRHERQMIRHAACRVHFIPLARNRLIRHQQQVLPLIAIVVVPERGLKRRRSGRRGVIATFRDFK